MPYLKVIEELFRKKYQQNYESLREISYDSANDEHPTTLAEKAYNFDTIALKTYQYSENLVPCSPDAIYFGDKLYFIEFKNGRLDTQEKKRSLRLKFIEGPYIIMSKILKENRIYLSKEEFFKIPKVAIIVYNSSKNPSEVLKSRYDARFQLEEYKYTLLKNIYTINFKQFEKMVRKKIYPFNFMNE